MFTKISKIIYIFIFLLLWLWEILVIPKGKTILSYNLSNSFD